MALNTFSTFYYGLKIDMDNNLINFDEGSGELEAEVAIGTYNYSELVTAVKDAMDSVGNLVYTVSVDRDTRVITISSTSNFDILLSSGTNVASSPFELLGFTQGSDLTGAMTYPGASPSGFEYRPQFILQDYQDPETYKERLDASVNASASGEIEVISFGLVRYIELSLKYITNLPQEFSVIKNNPTGVADAVQFLTSITERGRFEFMPDISDRATYYTVVLEKLKGSESGTSFKLRELLSENLPNYYELNDLKLRVIE